MTPTLVNKNDLIPLIEENKNVDTLFQKMLDLTYNMDDSFCANVYIVDTNGIFFSKNNKLYYSDNKSITEITGHTSLKENLNKIKSFLFGEISNHTTLCLDKAETDMKMDIIEKKQNNIIIKENQKNIVKSQIETLPPIQKSKEELEIIQMIEETMEIYQQEVYKIKEIEKQIKILDDNKKSILKKNKEKVLTNFSKLKNDYDIYKKIQRKQNVKSDFVIPSLFVLKYNYFNQLIGDEQNKVILEQLDNLDLDEILNMDREINEEIVSISNKYGNESQKLNVKFDHSWEDLELETDSTEKNNSRLGGI
jgi:hypothetical protein